MIPTTCHASPAMHPLPCIPSIPARTIVRLNKLLDQVKAQAGAPVAASRAHVHLLKGPEDLAELVSGDAEPSISH